MNSKTPLPEDVPKRFLAVFLPSLRKCGNCKHFVQPNEARSELEANPIFAKVMQHLSPAQQNLAQTDEGPVYPADAQPTPEGGEDFKPVAVREVPKPVWDSWDFFGICKHPMHRQGRYFGDKCEDWR